EQKLRNEEQNAPCLAIPSSTIESPKRAGARLPAMWERGWFDTPRKKALLRAMIDKVVPHRVAAGGDRVHARVVWRGGAATGADVPVPVGSVERLSGAEQMREAIVRLAREGQSDQRIADWLNAHGHRSPMREVTLTSTVKNIRLQHGI